MCVCMCVHIYICIYAHIHTHMVPVSVFRQQAENHMTEHNSEYEEKLTYIKKLLELVTSAKRLF